MNRAIAFVAILAAFGLFLLWLSSGNSASSGDTDGWAKIIYIALSAATAAAMLAMGWRGNFSEAIRYTLIWVGLGFLLILAYSYRADVKSAWQRVGGELNPAMPAERSHGEIVLRRADDGHFYADVTVNNANIRMLADTGASSVALSLSDAKRAGIDTDKLSYIIPTSTAGGVVMSAEVTLAEVRVGSIVRKGVRATVGREMSDSLLGMSFFNTLSRFSIESDELVLKD